MNKQLHRDVWVGVVLLIFCVVVFAVAVQISGQAAYLPIALSILMALCALVITINGLRKTKEQQGQFQYALTVKGSKHAFMFMLFIFIYYLLFRYVSYWVATPVFIIFAQKHLRLKSWWVNLLITALYLIISYFLFVVILKLPIYKVGVLGRYFRIV
ncbi:hypothetical protein OBV_44080 [Oscillibacter valericigenes Sjm18-20]|nr:hypothetical protein OBV_44080 [Oscillibacter valericigenes Sjm18-20]